MVTRKSKTTLGLFSLATGEGHRLPNKLVFLPLRVQRGPHQESKNTHLGSLEAAGWEGPLQGHGTERRKAPKNKAKATVTRYEVGVEARHYDPSDPKSSPMLGKGRGTVPENDLDTLSKKNPTFFNTNPA